MCNVPVLPAAKYLPGGPNSAPSQRLPRADYAKGIFRRKPQTGSVEAISGKAPPLFRKKISGVAETPLRGCGSRKASRQLRQGITKPANSCQIPAGLLNSTALFQT